MDIGGQSIQGTHPVEQVGGVSRRRAAGPWRRLGLVAACLSLAICSQVGGAAGPGVAFAAGGSDLDPVSRLGTVLDGSGCPSAAVQVGEGRFVVCPEFSAVTTPDGIARVITLVAAGNPVIAEYQGTLPQGLAWGQTIDAVGDALGQPRRITGVYGPPTLVYMYATERYGSLELQFDGRGRLVRINACLSH